MVFTIRMNQYTGGVKVKLFKTDFSAKWINLELNGELYSIHFKDTFLKGVYDVSLWGNNGKKKIKVISTYPTLKNRIACGWVLLKNKINQLLQQ